MNPATIEADIAVFADELTMVLPGECLACYLERLVAEFGCHDHRFTIRWEAQQPRRMPALIRWLEARGGYCDCEAIMNAFGRGGRSAKHQRLQCDGSFRRWAGQDGW